MKEHFVTFEGNEVRAAIAKDKTLIICTVEPSPAWEEEPTLCNDGVWRGRYRQLCGDFDAPYEEVDVFEARCPFGGTGDQLWVKEAWAEGISTEGHPCIFYAADKSRLVGGANKSVIDVASGKCEISVGVDITVPKDIQWKLPACMPCWASRITLKITDVRVRRLQDISDDDVLEAGIKKEHCVVDVKCYGGQPIEIYEDRFFFEGAPDDGFNTAIDAYQAFWESVYGQDSWRDNPWVWVIGFKMDELYKSEGEK